MDICCFDFDIFDFTSTSTTTSTRFALRYFSFTLFLQRSGIHGHYSSYLNELPVSGVIIINHPEADCSLLLHPLQLGNTSLQLLSYL